MESLSKQYQNRFSTFLNAETEDNNVGNYRYIGGNSGRHLNYWLTQGRKINDMPKGVKKCACSHVIKENCYIEHKPTGKVVVLGNCCIKRYIPDSGRTCEQCGASHKNRKNNLCNSCRDRILRDQEIESRVYIQVPFERKDEAKILGGAKWDPLCKCWYIYGHNALVTEKFPKHSDELQTRYKLINGVSSS
jgi:hypothetical protein